VRRIIRKDLPAGTKKAINDRQEKADEKRAAGTLDIEQEWKSARQTRPLKVALKLLKSMAGDRERCMYCGDSHGSDMEHFWPKMPYPERMFLWPNLLLCCTECGRFKGDRFPVDNGAVVLIDPTSDDPWQHLDFDPDTGNIAARFDMQTNNWSPRGIKTVEILQLDRREALNAGYRKTWSRLRIRLEAAMEEAKPDTDILAKALRDADDHGLLGWCITGTGINVAPFSVFRQQHPDVWSACVQALTRS
jgi:uncharacterized protein (TIGR02646 family)